VLRQTGPSVVVFLTVALAVIAWLPAAAANPVPMPHALQGPDIFARENLVAWCIVPFDSQKRGPQQRVEMLQRLGIKRVAYDWRNEHVPQWDEEMDLYGKAGIELVGFWGFSDGALELMKRHKIKTQFWVMLAGKGKDQAEMVETAARQVEGIARKARQADCTVALYNHGGWGGEPENQIAVIELLKSKGIDNVGICYNLHHGHHRMKDFPTMLKKMRSYLWCLNLNGMKQGTMILPIGQGDDDRGILKAIMESGYRGPIGILNHRDIDAEQGLKQNIDGLKSLLRQLGNDAALKTFQ
jgi:sugar phosphate isomerase/epimerase